MRIRDLSKKDACDILEIIGDCLSCRTLNEFRQAIYRIQKLIKFEMAICLMSKKDEYGNVQSLDISNINYPSEWIEYYVANDYKRVDPILRANFSNFQLQFWADTYRRQPPQKEFLSIAEDFGLRQGYTLGVRNYTGEEGSLFSVSGPSLERGPRTETLLSVVIPHLHQAFCRIIKFDQKRNCSALTPREKEILKWMTQGKTSWEISMILHISERTVHFHAQNIMRKLNASSRIHAVAIALEEKIIESP